MGVAVLVLLFGCAFPVGTHASSAERQATQWLLRSHTGNPDELAELKGVNPDAYALVKALLTKRSLGLLDPTHPTASFAGAGRDRPQRVEQGPEAFALAPGELHAAHASLAESHAQVVALPYAEIQPAAHHDWLNWKSHGSDNDEVMVQNVLGAVAELKGNKAGLLSTHHGTTENALAADEESFASEATTAPLKPVALPAPKENSYLKGIDLSGDMPMVAASTPEIKIAAPLAKHSNSYLDGLDLEGGTPKAVANSKKIAQVQGSSKNFLASFSWDDEKPKQPKHLSAQIQTNSKNAHLLSWLGVVKTEPVHEVAAAALAKPSNPYLMDLS